MDPPKYSIIINFGGSFVPRATPAKDPIPILVNLSLSNTVTFMLPFLPTSLAKLAKRVGVVTLPGWFAKSLESHTAFAIVTPLLDVFLLHVPTIVIFFKW